jgi:hypothetical protein
MDPTWTRGCNPLLEVTPIPHLQVWTQPEPGAAILCWRSRQFLTFRYGPNLSQGLQSSAAGHANSSPSGMDPTWARGCNPLLQVSPICHLQVWTQPESGAAILFWRLGLFLTFRNEPNLQSSAWGYAYSSPSGMYPTRAKGCNPLLEATPFHHLYLWITRDPEDRNIELKVTPCPHFSYGHWTQPEPGAAFLCWRPHVLYELYIVQRTTILCQRQQTFPHLHLWNVPP